MLVIDGPFSDLDKARVEAIAEHLRRILNDPHVTIKKISPGSIVLRISSSEEALEQLNQLFVTGEVKELLGYRIREIKRLDEDTFTQFFKENWDELVKFVRDRPGRPLEAEDTALYAFSKAWEAGDLSKWALFRIARNAALDSARARQVSKRTEHAPEISELLKAVPTPEAILLHEELSTLLETALSSLAPQQRAVLTLRYLHEWPYRDVANALGMSESAVRLVALRARQRLKEALAHR
jgi:RNA polymerase sigma factor (sigma-70 family)